MSAKFPNRAPNRGFPGSSFKYTPLRHVRVLYVTFLQGLFRHAPRGCYHWDENEEESEIIITSENRLDQEVVEKKPAFTVTRGPVGFYGMGIDDKVTEDLQTGGKEKAVLVPGTITLNAISRVELEAEDLAWVAAEHIWLLRDMFLRMGFFDANRSPQIGAPSPAGSIISGDQGDEFYVVAVTLPFQFPRNSKFTPLGTMIVQGIEVAVDKRLRDLQEKAGYPYSDFENPVGVSESLAPSFAPQASNTYSRSPDPAGTHTYEPPPKVYHPLNPTKEVSVRVVRPFSKR